MLAKLRRHFVLVYKYKRNAPRLCSHSLFLFTFPSAFPSTPEKRNCSSSLSTFTVHKNLQSLKMTVSQPQSNQRQTIDLGNGLIMRWSTAADTDNLAKLLSESFRVRDERNKKERGMMFVRDTERD